MGRFYKTTPGTFVQNKMFEIPFKEIAATVAKVDADIEENEQAALKLLDTLKLDSLSKDKAYAEQKIAGYEDEVSAITSQIAEDPLGFRRKSSAIRDLGRRINKDFTQGEAFKIQQAYDTRQQNLADMKKAWEKSPDLFNFDDVNKMMALNDSNYEGFEKGYQARMLHQFVDIDDVEKIAKDYKADVTERLGAFEKDGKMYTSKDKTEEIKAEDIKSAVLTNLQNDTQLNNYYRQQVELGNITPEQYVQKIEDTANRVAEKYGYKKTSKGLTSIKDSGKSVAAFTHALNNPTVNATPGSVYNEPLLEKYKGLESGGNYSVAGIDNAVGEINAGQQNLNLTVSKLAETAGIVIEDPNIMAAVSSGDYSALKGLTGVNGQKISNELIYQHQQQYDALEFDKQILEKQKAKAIELGGENPDAWLKSHSESKSTTDMTGQFQGTDMLNKGASAEYNKQIKAWRDELHDTQGWYHEPIKFDAGQIRNLPKEQQDLLQDGITIQELIKEGYVKGKKPKADKGPDIEEQLTKQVLQGAGYTFEDTNTQMAKGYFDINAKYAKPTLGLDDNELANVQFEIVIDGQPIRAYVSETALSNQTITRYMDKDKMKAAHKIQEAMTEGVIDDDNFYMDGLNFTKVNGKNVVQSPKGVISTKQAIYEMANLYKAERNQILK